MKVPNMSEDSGISHIHVVVEATRISSLFKKVRVSKNSKIRYSERFADGIWWE